MNDLQPLRGCVCEREIGVHASEISVHGDRNTHVRISLLREHLFRFRREHFCSSSLSDKRFDNE